MFLLFPFFVGAHTRNIAFVLLLLLFFIYFSLMLLPLLCFTLRLFTKWRKMCNKNKIHMVLTPKRYQLHFQRLFGWIILLFIVFLSSPFNSSCGALSRLLYLIEAHIFHLAIQVKTSRGISIICSRNEWQKNRFFDREKLFSTLFGRNTNWNCEAVFLFQQ